MRRRATSWKRPGRRLSRWLIWTLLGSIITIALVSLGIWRLSGGRLLSVQTGSMSPAFRPGDALLVRPVAFGSLRPGQVVSYRSSTRAGQIVSHRLLHVNLTARTFVTKGDRLADPDPLVSRRQLVGQVSAVLPDLGRPLNFFHRPLGLIVIVYLPATIFAGRELFRLAERRYRPCYRLRGYR